MTEMRKLTLRPIVCGLLLTTAGALTVGCDDSAGKATPPRLSAESVETFDEESLDGKDPVLWEPYTIEEQRKVVAGFSWSNTQSLPTPAANSTEPPPLYYVQIYVRNADELRELDEMGVHYDLAPLFASEWPDASRAVVLPFSGDPEDAGGQFAFAIVPAVTYNMIREESLQLGADTYRAMILREVPEEARAADGSVSYSYVAGIGEFAKPHGEMSADGTVISAPTAEWKAKDKRFGRRLRRFVDRVASATRAVVDGIRRTVGAIALAVAPDARLVVAFVVKNRSERFPGTLSSVWGGPEPRLSHTRVNVTQLKGISLYDTYTNDAAMANLTVVRGLKTRVCAEADSSAAQMEDGLLWPVRACSKEFTPRHDSTSVLVSLDSDAFHSLAQFIDSRNFARAVLGFTPPKAKVQRGWIANTFSKDRRPFVPCLAGTNAPSLVVDALAQGLNFGGAVVSGVTTGIGLPLPPIPVGTMVEYLMASDIILPDGGAESRATATHEYGHFFLCSLLANTNPHSYNMVWSQVTAHALADDADSEVRAINEGFADWFAAQVAGGTNYFNDNTGFGEWSSDDFFYSPTAAVSGRGMETNFGTVLCSDPTSPGFPACQPIDAEQLSTNVASIATLLHDVVDRANCTDSCARETGTRAAWSFSNEQFIPSQAQPMSVDDEQIAADPRRIVNSLRSFAASTRPDDELLRFNSFFRHLTQELSLTYSDGEICRLFALHTKGATCPEPSLQQWSVTAGTSGPGSVDPSNAVVRDGDSITLQAETVTGYAFAGWSGDEVCASTDPRLVIASVASDVYCQANFVPSYYISLDRPIHAPGSSIVDFPVSGTVLVGGGTCNASGCEVNAGSEVQINVPGGQGGSIECRNSSDGSTTGAGSGVGSLVLSNVQGHWECTGFIKVI